MAIGMMRNFGIVGISEFLRTCSFRLNGRYTSKLTNWSKKYDDYDYWYQRTLANDDIKEFKMLYKKCISWERYDMVMLLASIILKKIHEVCRAYLNDSSDNTRKQLLQALYSTVESTKDLLPKLKPQIP